jgi:hypothetical protein
MKLKTIRAHFYDGKIVAVGTVYEAPDRFGRELIATGKCIESPADQPAKKASKSVMTTASASALVAGSEIKEQKDVI